MSGASDREAAAFGDRDFVRAVDHHCVRRGQGESGCIQFHCKIRDTFGCKLHTSLLPKLPIQIPNMCILSDKHSTKLSTYDGQVSSASLRIKDNLIW